MTVYRRRFTILGCGSSPGVPRINGDWGACDAENTKNLRTRAAFMVEQFAPDGGATTVIIDTGPDLRVQMIAAKVNHIDAVLYTHAHADHLHGIDDLRGYFISSRQRIPIYADPLTMQRIHDGFPYCIETPPGSNYPPIVEPHLIDNLDETIEINGPGGTIQFQPHMQHHGDSHSLGYRIGDIAYCTDVSDFPSQTLSKLMGLDVLVIDTLQYHYHPSHLSVEQSLGWIEKLKPKRAIFTHMHTPLDYDTVMRETPDHIEPGYDQMRFEIYV